MNLTDATTNGSGQVTLDIWPNARNHANPTNLTLASPKLIMRLTDSTITPFEEGTDKWYSIEFGAEEAR
jgi:hypothetical protein